MSIALLTSLEQEYGKTGFCQKFDVIEEVVRQLFVEAKEELVFQREEAKRKINTAESDVASMIGLFDHFKGAFGRELQEQLQVISDKSACKK